MGVAGLFRQVIKYNKRVHNHLLKKAINYFLIDFNSIVYKAQGKLDSKMREENRVYKEANKKSYEKDLIGVIIDYTQKIICKDVKPDTLVYIAVDGPAPRAKMIQQRSRRFKGIKEKTYIDAIRADFNETVSEKWNASSNTAPGTEFMYALTNGLKEAIEKNRFSVDMKRDIIFSSGQVPGEGEHKYMPIIRKLHASKKLRNKTVCIYSGDGDMIPLSIVSDKNNIFLMMDGSRAVRELPQYEDKEYIYLNIDEVKKALHFKLNKGMFKNSHINIDDFTLDYAFMLSLGGNDFLHGLPFTVVKNQGIDEFVIPIYRNTFDDLGQYLCKFKVDGKKKRIDVNMEFLKQIFIGMAEMEDNFMKKYKKERIDGVAGGRMTRDQVKSENEMEGFQLEMKRFEHYPINSPKHPLNDIYAADFLKVDYSKKHDEWKKQYYKFYMGVDYNTDGEEAYKGYIHKVCEKYLKTLLWAIQYYAEGCPSWSFHYGFRVSPMPSDVVDFLNDTGFDLNEFEFDLGKPYTPFEQLMFILPPQMKGNVPKNLGELMTNPKKLLVPYYPIDFRVDATVGKKWMYSEAILPEIDDEFFLKIVREEEKKLKGREKLMNAITMKPMRKSANNANNSSRLKKKRNTKRSKKDKEGSK